MFEKITIDDISSALNELVTCFGVKEELPFHDFVTHLRKRDAEGCVQGVAIGLGLPIRIILSYVPAYFRPDNSEGFSSSSLVQTDWTGRGVAGITAQVSIPQSLPMFGSSALQDYPIRVRVSENCHEHPETFVAIMAHELSHILLTSLWHPQKDSELHVDLTPILLGFRDIVRRGRKNIESTTSGSIITTHTTTYGYLTDSQFDFACSYVNSIVIRHQRDKKHLLGVAEQLRRRLKKASRSLATFRDYFRYLDRHPPKKMRNEHAQRVVQLHTHDYIGEWEDRITAIRTSIKSAETFARSLTHYTSNAVEHLKKHTQVLELASDQLGQLIEEITRDQRLLRRYIGFICRLRITLWHQS